MMEIVRFKTGAPVAGDFASAKGALVVDTSTSTGRIYFLDDGGNVRECGDYLTAATIATLTVSTLLNLTGGQIKFPATAVPSADANTLDDYEEGTTSPTPTAGSGTFTSASASVTYTKIGNRVTVRAAVVITTNGTAGGYVTVPMPFTAAEITPLCGLLSTGGYGLMGGVNGANMNVFKYDGTYPGGDGKTLQMQCTFRV